MNRTRHLTMVLTTCLLTVMAFQRVHAAATSDRELGGHIIAKIGGKNITFPSLKTEIAGDVQGDLAMITVRQTFANPTQVPMNVRYLFPLNKDAAVHGMKMQVGDEVVLAKIAKRDIARKTFQTAKRQGKSAALLEQHRPNMFTQDIANLMPGLPVTITLTYSQVVPRVDAAYELRVPLIVGPRYIPRKSPATPRSIAHRYPDVVDNDTATKQTEQSVQTSGNGQWKFAPIPSYPPVPGLRVPETIDRKRVSLTINLASGIAISDVTSATHVLDVSGEDTNKVVTLAGGKTVNNRDFVLRYSLAAKQPRAGVLLHKGEKENTFSLLIEPPRIPDEANIGAREMVFVLDTSGSMRGAPMRASKAFMLHALQTLRPTDYFRIVRFSSNATEFGNGPVSATSDNITAGIIFVNGLRAGGGTEMLTGLRTAYRTPPPKNTLRIVVFLSDGYIGNEAEILNLVAGSVDSGRLYAFGIGTSINRYLISEMARIGRGMSRIVDPTADGNTEAIKFARTLKTPVLTDIQINWGTLKPKDVSPAFIPDLFEGDSIRVQGQFTDNVPHTVEVSGNVNGRPVTMPLRIDATLPSSPGSEAIPLIWARSRIADHMRELVVPAQLRRSRMTNTQLQQQVTNLGLEHAIVTQWTSFVAVSRRIINPDPTATVSADVPLPMVKGVEPSAYPQAPQTQRASAPAFRKTAYTQPINSNTANISFAGGSTPEPEQIFGIFLLLLTLGGALARKVSQMDG